MILLHTADLFDILPKHEAESIHACVTDPPYGIGFMGKKWDTFNPAELEGNERKALRVEHGVEHEDDYARNPNTRGRVRSPAISPSQIEYDRSLRGQRGFQVWTTQWAFEVWRVLKPGGYLLVCGAPRSFHRMACGLEDAGFVVRDCLCWLFGQGFPKSLNVTKALGDKLEAVNWEGWGTALKPSWEPIIVARKPLDGTVAHNVLTHDTGGMNIDACRLDGIVTDDLGRWPANVVVDPEAAALIDEQAGPSVSGANPEHRSSSKFQNTFNPFEGEAVCMPARGNDAGGVSRFYYCAKPSREERDMGCEGLQRRSGGEATDREDNTAGLNSPRSGAGRTGGARNYHPTVKPLALMRWLVRLVTPPGGIVLDPFMGSGTTGMACRYEQFSFVGVEKEAEYVTIAERRIAAAAPLLAAMAEETAADILNEAQMDLLTDRVAGES